MKAEKLFNKACEEKINGCPEKAYDMFAEIVYNYPGTIFAIYANEEMTGLSVNNAVDYDDLISYTEASVA